MTFLENRLVPDLVSDRPGGESLNQFQHKIYLVKTSKRGPGSIFTLQSEPILRGKEKILVRFSA